MEEIKVGEYVRIARNQGINRIIEIEENNRYILDEDIADEYGDLTCFLEKYQLKDEILKHSSNIIDLIEVGDYINGEKITDIQTEYYDINLDKVLPLKTPKIIVGNEEGVLSVDKILTVATKEQFEGIEYRLED